LQYHRSQKKKLKRHTKTLIATQLSVIVIAELRKCLWESMMQNKNKYYNRKVKINGIQFDSVKEAKRYTELQLLQRAGIISDLQRQVSFELIPAQYIDGKLVERKATYIADFVYLEGGEKIVEDVKGVKTDVYKLKKKLMLMKGIRIKEV
jgi:hypothetical protein